MFQNYHRATALFLLSNSMFINSTNMEDIISVIDGFKNTNSADLEEININILKAIKHEICSPLSYLINQSLNSGFFSEILKLQRLSHYIKKYMLY